MVTYSFIKVFGYPFLPAEAFAKAGLT